MHAGGEASVGGSGAEPMLRIRDLLTKPVGKQAESHLTEPTGVGYAVANFVPLPKSHFNPLPEAPNCPFRDRDTHCH